MSGGGRRAEADAALTTVVAFLHAQAQRYDRAAQCNRGNRHEARLAGGAAALRRAAARVEGGSLETWEP